ncbi:MAG TPA: hypothetical protein VGI19_14395 [Candidatus Cybelea sp.]|jgi:hypothetical protein
MRHFGTSAAIALLILGLLPVVANAQTWQPASASNISAGAAHSTFIVQASVTLPNACYTARVRSTPITLHTSRSFYVEQLAPSGKCTKGTAAYTCTVVSPEFPLPIPHAINVISKGPRTTEVKVSTEESHAAPPLCRTS